MSSINPILITGSHRSGTTWVGRALELADGVRYVQEPFNRETNPDLAGYKLKNMFAHAPDEDAPELKLKFMEFLNPQEDECLLLKDPIAVFSSPWIQDELDAKVVCMVRHPAGFVSSLIKWQWEFHFGYFTSQPELMASFDPDIRDQITKFSQERQEPILQACLLWKAIYGWVLQQNPKKRKWILLNYEDAADNPTRHFKRLYKKLGLKWTREIDLEIREMTGSDKPSESDDPGFKARNSKAMRAVWQKRLSQEQIELIKRETAPVWSSFYSRRDWLY